MCSCDAASFYSSDEAVDVGHDLVDCIGFTVPVLAFQYIYKRPKALGRSLQRINHWLPMAYALGPFPCLKHKPDYITGLLLNGPHSVTCWLGQCSASDNHRSLGNSLEQRVQLNDAPFELQRLF